MNIRRITVAGLAAVAATVGLASPAFAIAEADCRLSNEFVRITVARPGGATAERCYANAGSKDVSITSSLRVYGGNNDGNVEYVENVTGTPRWTPFFRGQTTAELGAVRITKVTIYAR